MGPFSGFGPMSTLLPVLVMMIFALGIGLFIFAIVKGARSQAANKAAPEVTAVASIVDKRIETSGGGDMSVSQQHFVSFEQPGGERFELEVPAGEFGLLVVGDQGTVTMKGTQYLGFARELLR